PDERRRGLQGERVVSPTARIVSAGATADFSRRRVKPPSSDGGQGVDFHLSLSHTLSIMTRRTYQLWRASLLSSTISIGAAVPV
ncbi:MAG: hypothetical protein RLP09_15390, partial [Sandaracinaceae bacterium]